MNLIRKFLILIGILSGIMFISGFTDSTTAFKVVTKLVPTFCLALYLLFSKVSKRNLFVFIGILFSMAGDFFMIFDKNQLLLAIGILTNLLGIVCYLIYFLGFSKELKLQYIWPVFAVITIMYVLLFENLGPLKIPVFFYCSFFILLVWRANIAKDVIKNTEGLYLFWSALSLIISDCLLSVMLFNIIDFSIVFYGIEMVLWWGGLIGLTVFSVKEKESTSEGKSR